MARKGTVKVTVKKTSGKKPIIPKTGVGQVGLLTQPIVANVEKRKAQSKTQPAKK